MPRRYQEVEVLLQKLADVMQESGLWADNHPSDKALASDQPFAWDTMTLENWLQFIFIPSMRALLKGRLSLPDELALLPVAQQRFAHSPNYHELLLVIEQIDQLFNE